MKKWSRDKEVLFTTDMEVDIRCYVQDSYFNCCLFLYIATFICKHEILMRQKVEETIFCNVNCLYL